jgi:hypothetical protein
MSERIEKLTCNQICRVCSECRIPYPFLMPRERFEQGEIVFLGRPQFDRVICRTRRKGSMYQLSLV